MFYMQLLGERRHSQQACLKEHVKNELVHKALRQADREASRS